MDSNEENYLKTLDFLNKYDESKIPWKWSFYYGKNLDSKNIQAYSEASFGLFFSFYLEK